SSSKLSGPEGTRLALTEQPVTAAVMPSQPEASASIESVLRQQPASTTPSSTSRSAWTKRIANTQISAQTSIPSQSGCRSLFMHVIEEDVEHSPATLPQDFDYPQNTLEQEITASDRTSTMFTTSVTFSPQQREDAIERFSRAILKSLQMNLNCCAASNWSRQHTLPLIQQALKTYSQSARVDESEAAQVKGLKLIRHLRTDIAQRIQDSVLGASQELEATNPTVDLTQVTEMDVSEKISRWHSMTQQFDRLGTMHYVHGRVKYSPSSTSSSRLSVNTRSDIDLEDAQLFGTAVNPVEILGRLKEQPVFVDLVKRIETLLQQYHGQKMHLIRQKTSLALRRQTINRETDGTLLSAVFKIGWNLPGFLSKNYPAGIRQNLKKIIAVTGQVEGAKLCSVGEYLKANWPGEEKHLLMAAEEALLGRNRWSSRLQKSLFGGSKRSRKLSFDGSMDKLTARGDEDFIISIAQQLAWLAAVCQEKEDEPTYAYVGFDEVPSNTPGMPVFKIEAKLEKIPLMQNKDQCWISIVGPAVLIQGFPVPARSHGEKGLEVNIATMATILNTPKAVTFGNGFVFKARCQALVPIERLGSSIQWHVLDTYPRKLEWEEIDRAFDYSKAVTISKRVQIEKVVFGFSQWVTFTADISLGRKDGVINQRPDDYEAILDDARDTPIIIHDTFQKRAYQTNAEDLTLQILLHRKENQAHDRQPVANSQQGEPFVFANPDRRAKPTRQVMLENAEKISSIRKQFSSADEQARRFKNDVKLVYSTIDSLWANAYASEAKSSLKVGLSIGSDVHGWEYMDILNDHKSIRPKSVSLKRTSGRWDKYAIDIKAVVLFAANIGDILLPAQPSATCLGFASLPKDECYLAVKVDSIQSLYSRQGCSQDQKKLTDSGLTLHCHADLFNICQAAESPQHQPCCQSRLVRLIKSSALTRNYRPIEFKKDGAVIIGQSKSFSVTCDWKSTFASKLAISADPEQTPLLKPNDKGLQQMAGKQKAVDINMHVPQVGDIIGAETRSRAISAPEPGDHASSTNHSIASGSGSSPMSVPISGSMTSSSHTSASQGKTWGCLKPSDTLDSREQSREKELNGNGRIMTVVYSTSIGHSA
ncbi:hypothetical protein EDB81DRAFT_639970, partial [Dactylonectria macrodidyma]